jgi:hypothetical protein
MLVQRVFVPPWLPTPDAGAATPGHHAPREVRMTRRRQVKLALLTGRTVPYSLSTLLDAGIGVTTIRKVYRGQ